MKLLIAVPALDYMHSEFVRSLIGLTAKLKDQRINFETRIESGTLVYVARDKLAKYAINEEFTRVLWLDSDVVFQDTLLEDLEFSGGDFVTGIYHSRRTPFASTVFKSIEPPEWYRLDEYPKQPFEIAGCGFGAVLINTIVLKDVMLADKTCFCPMRNFGEDLAFCKRARDKGYKIIADPSVRLGHIGHITVYPDDSATWLAQIKSNQ